MEIYEKWIKLRFFGIFKKLTMFLREENKIIFEHQMKIVQKFRLIKLGRKILFAIRDHATEEKVNRDKDVYKEKIFNKVQMWLKEYDQKDEENINTINKGDTKVHEKFQMMQTITQRADEYSFMSKDMFDEKFEMTKDELFSNHDYNAMVLNSRINDSKVRLKPQLNLNNSTELNNTAALSNKSNTLEFFDKELNKILSL